MNKSDRELLELAAKASGLPIQFHRFMNYPIICTGNEQDGDPIVMWNPLVDDGDALRLAVKLMMSVEISEDDASTFVYAGNVPRVWACEMWWGDKDAATRRAIVRAAAEVARRENL